MSNIRNFWFSVPPEPRERKGRFSLAGTTDLPIGTPVTADTTADEDDLGLRPVDPVTGATDPIKGESGIVVYEHLFVDDVTTTSTDKDTVPAGAACQVVSGNEVKVVFRNTEDTTFLNTRTIDGRVMVAGLGATLTLAVGDLLTPGTGNDTDGYWQETATATEAWLRITKVDNDRSEVEAQMLF